MIKRELKKAEEHEGNGVTNFTGALGMISKG